MYDCSYQTGRRPEFKSRAESQIGEFLDSRRIPYIYEKPTAVVDAGKTKIWYSDYSLQCGPLIEYFGITGDRHYMESVRHKLRVYQENLFDVIPINPTDMIPQWPDNLLRRIVSVLARRIQDFHR